MAAKRAKSVAMDRQQALGQFVEVELDSGHLAFINLDLVRVIAHFPGRVQLEFDRSHQINIKHDDKALSLLDRLAGMSSAPTPPPKQKRRSR